MIQVEHLTKRYGSRAAVDDLSFTVQPGQIYGLLGPNGAGKTTTMNILTGYISATSGAVTIEGHDILEEPMAAKRCMGYLPEQPPLYPEMSVYEYLDFAAQLKGVSRPSRPDQVQAAMEKAGVADMASRLIRNLSKGYKQRVGLACALLGEPPIIILDEPTVGLDPAQMIEFRALIRQLGRQHTVILSSHILSEVSAVCDQVLIISHGRLAAQGTPEELGRMLEGKSRLRVTALGDVQAVLNAVQAVDGVLDARLEHQSGNETRLLVETSAGTDKRADISLALAAAGCPVLAMEAEALSLEDVFLQLTGETPASPGPMDGENNLPIDAPSEAEPPAEEAGSEGGGEE